MRHAYRLRRAVNIANGSTLGGLLVAAVGRARFAPGPDGLTVAHRLRLPMRSYACCGGLVMLPMYGIAAAMSWMLTGSIGARNVFERRAGLADGGYQDSDLRPAVRRAIRKPGQRPEP